MTLLSHNNRRSKHDQTKSVRFISTGTDIIFLRGRDESSLQWSKTFRAGSSGRGWIRPTVSSKTYQMWAVLMMPYLFYLHIYHHIYSFPANIFCLCGLRFPPSPQRWEDRILNLRPAVWRRSARRTNWSELSYCVSGEHPDVYWCHSLHSHPPGFCWARFAMRKSVTMAADHIKNAEKLSGVCGGIPFVYLYNSGNSSPLLAFTLGLSDAMRYLEKPLLCYIY